MKRALVLSLAIIFGLGVAAFSQTPGTLSGEWTVDIKIDATESDFAKALDFSSTLSVDYVVGGWTFGSSSSFDDAGWTDQVFTAVGSLGAYLFDSTLDLDPAGLFESWLVTGGVTMGGMTFGLTATLYPNDLAVVISGSGSTNLVTISAALTFGHVTYVKAQPDAVPAVAGVDGDGCDLDWQGIKITAGFPFCCADVAATIEFSCAGFEYASFKVVGLTMANIPWLSIDATLKYTLATKTLTLSPSIDLGEVSCDFELYAGIGYGGGDGPFNGLSIGDIYIDGIGVACTIGGVEFSGISYWGTSGFTTKPAALLTYWEMYKIATTDDGCCGDFAFDVAVFFAYGNGGLFDVAAFDANMSLDLASQFALTMGLFYDVENALQTWDIGFIVTW